MGKIFKEYFINLGAISYISIYLITIFIILTPFLNGYIFILDFTSKVNIDNNLKLLYGYVTLEYGGLLPILFISIAIFRESLIFIILFCSAYSIYNLEISSKMSRFYIGLLYMINPYVYIRIVTGQLFLLLSYAIFPFLLKTFIDFLDKKEKKEMTKFMLLLSIVAINIHILIISLIIMTIIFLFWFNKYRDTRIMKPFAIFGILFMLLNSYWIIPVLTVKNTIVDNITDKDLEVYAPKGSLFDIAAMYGFWREGYIYTKDFIPGWQILYLIILSLAIIGFLGYYKDEKIGYLAKAMAVIGIIGFILASGIKGPFGDQIYWLFDNTILKGFRDSHKFVSMMVLSYALLGGLGVNKIRSIYDDIGSKK